MRVTCCSSAQSPIGRTFPACRSRAPWLGAPRTTPARAAARPRGGPTRAPQQRLAVTHATLSRQLLPESRTASAARLRPRRRHASRVRAIAASRAPDLGVVVLCDANLEQKR